MKGLCGRQSGRAWPMRAAQSRRSAAGTGHLGAEGSRALNGPGACLELPTGQVPRRRVCSEPEFGAPVGPGEGCASRSGGPWDGRVCWSQVQVWGAVNRVILQHQEPRRSVTNDELVSPRGVEKAVAAK